MKQTGAIKLGRQWRIKGESMENATDSDIKVIKEDLKKILNILESKEMIIKVIKQ